MTRRLLPEPGAAADPWAFEWAIPERFNIAERCCQSWARETPERTALIHLHADGRETRWSCAELERAVDRFARCLAARGIGRGDRVAVLLSQGPETLVSHFAAFRLGAITVPLFTLFGPEALSYRLADSGAAVAVTDAENLPKLARLRPDLPALRLIYCTEPLTEAGASGTLDFHAEIAASPGNAPACETQAEDPAVLIYTSGTTGPPKGALHAHRFLLGHLPCVEMQHEGLPAEGDVGWTPADWAWIGGLMDLAMPCLYYGVPLVSHRMRKFTAEAAWELIARFGVNRLFLPPTALRLLRRSQVPAGISIRSIGSGGESLGDDLLRWGQEVLGTTINEIYGQTECNLVICASQGRGVGRAGTMGRAVPGHRVAVIGPDGQELPPDTEGEIAVAHPDPVMFLGYWNQPEQTARKFDGAWMRTGDLGRADGDGYVTYGARDDDVITSSGYRIGPTEIENCLAAHPDVVMAAVVGLPDPERTEAVTGFVVLREGADWNGLEQVLIARVRDQVSPHLAPRRIFRRDSLPVTATGKIIRRELRKGD